MIRSTFLYLFLLLSATGRAQQPVNPLPDTTVFVIQPTTFQLASGEPFFRWIEKPDTFEFLMFDRWGEIVAKSEKPDFKIDDALLDNKPPLRISDTYLYIVRLSFKGKPEQVYRVHVVYTGKYCSG